MSEGWCLNQLDSDNLTVSWYLPLQNLIIREKLAKNTNFIRTVCKGPPWKEWCKVVLFWIASCPPPPTRGQRNFIHVSVVELYASQILNIQLTYFNFLFLKKIAQYNVDTAGSCRFNFSQRTEPSVSFSKLSAHHCLQILGNSLKAFFFRTIICIVYFLFANFLTSLKLTMTH